MFTWPVRIYYEDTDSGGVVYYANYLKFMERARSEWLRAIGYEQDVLARQGIIFAVRSAALQFLKPARFNELLHVSAALKRLGRASLAFEQQISRVHASREPEVLTLGEISIVCLEVDTFQPRSIPSTLKKDLQRAG
jgi:acyl-CoA thioester hydrolase